MSSNKNGKYNQDNSDYNKDGEDNMAGRDDLEDDETNDDIGKENDETDKDTAVVAITTSSSRNDDGEEESVNTKDHLVQREDATAKELQRSFGHFGGSGRIHAVRSSCRVLQRRKSSMDDSNNSMDDSNCAIGNTRTTPSPGLQWTREDLETERTVLNRELSADAISASKTPTGLGRTRKDLDAKIRAISRATAEGSTAVQEEGRRTSFLVSFRGLRRSSEELEAKRSPRSHFAASESDKAAPTSDDRPNTPRILSRDLIDEEAQRLSRQHRERNQRPYVGAFFYVPPQRLLRPRERQRQRQRPTTNPPIATGAAGLVEATPVADLPIALEVDPGATDGQPKRQAKNCLPALIGILLLCALLATVLGVVFGLRDDPNLTEASKTPTVAPSMSPTVAPSAAPTSIMNDFYHSLPNYTLANLQEPFSPQSQAYDWLVHHENITHLPEWRKTQLFAMSTFFYAFDGTNWPRFVQKRYLDQNKHECNWFSSEHGAFWDGIFYPADRPQQMCNDQSQLTKIVLRTLDFSRLQDPSLPPELALLTSLSVIDFRMNNLNATLVKLIPSQLSKSPSKLVIHFNDNFINGPIPTELGMVANLLYLHLDDNFISGALPTELGLLTGMKGLNFPVNYLTGVIPTELGMMKNLTGLHLENNDITGVLPTEMGLLTNMEALYLYNNAFTGPIPTELSKMTSLLELRPNGNSLSGAIPSELGMLTSLEVLDLRNNSLVGAIPTELGMMANLTELLLAGNSFTGEIPSELGMLTCLTRLEPSNLHVSVTFPLEGCH